MFQRTGLLSMLDVECSLRGCAETYVQKVKVQHKDNKKLFAPKHCDLARTFGIHHYAGWYSSGFLKRQNKFDGIFHLIWCLLSLMWQNGAHTYSTDLICSMETLLFCGHIIEIDYWCLTMWFDKAFSMCDTIPNHKQL